jgi:hypothetical protein
MPRLKAKPPLRPASKPGQIELLVEEPTNGREISKLFQDDRSMLLSMNMSWHNFEANMTPISS